MACVERNLIKAELKQMKEQGCDTQEIEIRILESINNENCEDSEFVSLYEELTALPIDPNFAFDEPSTLEKIKALRPDAQRQFERTRNGVPLDSNTLYDCVYCAWLGRAAGCALGKPVEGWPKARIDKYLKEAGVLPLDNYLPYIKEQMPRIHIPSSRGNIEYMDRDDDMDFTILGLLALEQAGADISARNIANMWISKMPFGKLYTAENAAYRNFTQSIWPPNSAAHRNPFREWIGAQIRADIFGYVAPGLPERAAQLAFTDASISHKKNGIYGEMFVAAMIAAAFITDKAEEIVAAGLGEIPANCRLAGAVRGISDIIIKPGLINVDFADVKTVMSEKGTAMMGTGTSSGPDRARIAAEHAVASKLLEDISLQDAKGVLVNITAGKDLSLGEIKIVGECIKEFASEEAIVIQGTVLDESAGNDLTVTVIATGLGSSIQRSSNLRSVSGVDGAASTINDESRKYLENPPKTVNDSAIDKIEDDYLDIPSFVRTQLD